ncbi:MAG TPA: efflux RND transporter periplasmic adaptor subunit [Acidimicrobiales bacterium]|nr:efflux RND transporter periplasmic adaptor subunit [Acidimicrobiales bacterium]
MLGRGHRGEGQQALWIPRRAAGRTAGRLQEFVLVPGVGNEADAPATNGHGSGAGSPPEPAEEAATGLGLVRTGLRDLGEGAVQAFETGVAPLRRVLPGRARELSSRRLAAVVLAVLVVVAAVVAGAAVEVVAGLKGATEVVAATAGPAEVHSAPGGVGSLSAAPQNVAVVSLDAVGVTAPIQVTAVDVIAGEEVSAGTPLLALDPLPFEQDKQQVLATLAQAEQALASATAAATKGASLASGQAYLAVQIPTLQGQVAIDQQLAQIAEGNASSLTAPIAGSISYVRVSPGQVVSVGSSMIQIVDPSTVDVSAGMQLSDLRSIAAGDAATITPTQLPGVTLHGTVVAVSASAANGGLEGTVVISAQNLARHPVPIGTQAFVTVDAPVRAAVAVPSIAVLNAELAPAVVVVRNGRAEFRTVQIGASDTRETQIVSGLRPGERVAMTNLQDLTDGSPVRVSSSRP